MEEWLKKLVEEIKEKDHAAGEQAVKQQKDQAVISNKGPIYWRSLADFLNKFVNEIRSGLSGDVTEGQLSFSFDPRTNQIQISKSAFPFLNFSAAPEFTVAGSCRLTYSKNNPLPTQTTNVNPIPCRFEVLGEETLTLQLNGQDFQEPEHAARFLIEKLFSV